MEFETILHHTLRNDENPQYVEDNAPFRVENVKEAYLGDGYYFWDDHLELAHWWGSVHCNENYIICEADFIIPKDDFCDLVGSRQDQQYLMDCIEKFGLNGLSLGEAIGMLTEINSKPGYGGAFSFKAIRAIDVNKNSFGNKYPEIVFKFSSRRKGLTSLTPQIIVCLKMKDPDILKNFKIIFPDLYVV